MSRADDATWPSQIDVDGFAEDHGGWWDGEHPLYPLKTWQREVVQLETRYGYWEWALRQAESDGVIGDTDGGIGE